MSSCLQLLLCSFMELLACIGFNAVGRMHLATSSSSSSSSPPAPLDSTRRCSLITTFSNCGLHDLIQRHVSSVRQLLKLHAMVTIVNIPILILIINCCCCRCQFSPPNTVLLLLLIRT